MRKAMAIALKLAGFLGFLAWIAGYLWITGLACAFKTSQSDCDIPLPWQLRNQEDFMLLVLIPGCIVAGLFLVAWKVGRSK
ncbi:hypothetical protein [Kiloniella sp. b19]|uniref:hypothetical protein n=1 Tax=Kiloniella sp. GXU_MW_B19 TaxID=3141326 RepID=UPI0031CE9B3C